jgi:hypothetical protein
VNRKLKSKWSDGRLYPVDLSEALCRALYVQERRSIWLSHELVTTYSVDGTFIFDKRGGPNAVGLTIGEMAVARQAVWTHNHPWVSALSVDDIQRAFESQVAELRAVDPKWVYRLRDPGGWPASKLEPMLLAMGIELARAKREGVADIQERNHLGMAAAANAVGLTYSRNRWSPPLRFVLAIRAWLNQTRSRRHE